MKAYSVFEYNIEWVMEVLITRIYHAYDIGRKNKISLFLKKVLEMNNEYCLMLFNETTWTFSYIKILHLYLRIVS